mgnify:CR=1 FL=1
MSLYKETVLRFFLLYCTEQEEQDMELIKGIKERRSTRKFTDQAVSEEEIREIVSAAATHQAGKIHRQPTTSR